MGWAKIVWTDSAAEQTAATPLASVKAANDRKVSLAANSPKRTPSADSSMLRTRTKAKEALTRPWFATVTVPVVGAFEHTE